MQVRRNSRQVPIHAEARRTYAYVRCSTEGQVREGVSLDVQAEKIQAYGLAMGYAISEVVRDEGESGKSLDRPGVARIIAEVRRGEVARVIVHKLDRLTRSALDLMQFINLCNENEVALVSLTDKIDTGSAAGRMLVKMLGLVIEWERESVVERTTAALSHKRVNRKAYGPTPFGFRREGKDLIEDAAEQAGLVEAKRMYAANVTYREIGEMLEARGLKPHRAVKWYPSNVRAVLLSRMVQEAA